MKTINCPVCGWEIKDAGIKIKPEDRELIVCCDECAAKVEKDPQVYTGAFQ